MIAILLLALIIPIANACTISPGVKCYDAVSYGYQYANCSWGALTVCTYNCSSGMCNPPPFNYSVNMTNNSVTNNLMGTGDPLLIGLVLLLGFMFGLAIIQAPIELYVLVLIPLSLIIGGIFVPELGVMVLIPIALLVGFVLVKLVHR